MGDHVVMKTGPWKSEKTFGYGSDLVATKDPTHTAEKGGLV